MILRFLLYQMILVAVGCTHQAPTECAAQAPDADILFVGGSNSHALFPFSTPLPSSKAIVPCNAQSTSNMQIYMPLWLNNRSYKTVLIFSTMWDLTNQATSDAQYSANLKGLIGQVKQHGAQPVLVLNVKPVDAALDALVQQRNILAAAIASKQTVPTIDLYYASTFVQNEHIDGVHYTEIGNQYLGQYLAQELLAFL